MGSERERRRFVQRVTSRIGGAYCTPPEPGRCSDCSGLVAEEYQNATGETISGSSHEQMRLGTAVGDDPAGWEPGDLLFYDTMGVTANGNRASHVGVYAGGGEAVHAMNARQGTIRSRIDGEYWRQRFIGARRLFPIESRSRDVEESRRTTLLLDSSSPRRRISAIAFPRSRQHGPRGVPGGAVPVHHP